MVFTQPTIIKTNVFNEIGESDMNSDRLENGKLSLEHVDHLIDIKNNPAVKATILAVMKSIPIIGELVDSSTDALLTAFQKKKRQELIDVILSNNEYITYDKVNDVEFIMNFAKTLEAVNKLSRNDKVKYFGNLLRNSYLCINKVKNDEFENNMQILMGLSYSDIVILESLKSNYVKIPNYSGNQREEFRLALEQTINGIVNEIQKSKEWVIATLDKLSGIGVCTKSIYQSFVWGTTITDVHYVVSPLYENLRKFILNNSEK